MKLVKADFTTLVGEHVLTWRPKDMMFTKGEAVLVWDPDDGLCANATVEQVKLTDLLYLSVDWDTQIHYRSISKLPKDKYLVEESEDGWTVYAKEDYGEFS